jgi:hypothetical protein
LFTYAGILWINLSLIFILLASSNERMSSLYHRLMKVSTTFVLVSRVMDPSMAECFLKIVEEKLAGSGLCFKVSK